MICRSKVKLNLDPNSNPFLSIYKCKLRPDRLKMGSMILSLTKAKSGTVHLICPFTYRVHPKKMNKHPSSSGLFFQIKVYIILAHLHIVFDELKAINKVRLPEPCLYPIHRSFNVGGLFILQKVFIA